MYKTDGNTQAQTRVATTSVDASWRSRICDDFTAQSLDEARDVITSDAALLVVADIPAHLPSLPSWHDVANMDFTRSVYASRALPQLEARALRDLVDDTRPMMGLLTDDASQTDMVTRYYVALRAMAEYEATLFPQLQKDFEWLQGVASRRRGGKTASKLHRKSASEGASGKAGDASPASTSESTPKRKRRTGIWRCWTDMFADIFSPRGDNVDFVEDFYRALPGRYEAGLRRGLAALSLGHELTLSLITSSRIADYPGGEGWSDDAQRTIRHHADRALSKMRLRHGARSFYAERDFYQLVQFSDSVPSEAGSFVRFRRVGVSGADDRFEEGRNSEHDGDDSLDESSDGSVDAERDGYALDAATIDALKQSIDVQKGWPVMDARLVEEALVNARQAIDAQSPGRSEAAFAAYSRVREDIHEIVLTAFDEKIVAKASFERTAIEAHLDTLLRRAEEADAARGKRFLEAISGGADARPSMMHLMHDFIFSLPLHYRDGLRPMYLTLSFGTDSDLIDAACDILMPLAAELAEMYDYRPDDYEESDGAYDPMNDADAMDRSRARAQKSRELLWTLYVSFDGMAASSAPSRPQYKHVVADAEKAARYESDQYAKAMAKHKQRLGVASLHALLPAAGALIRKAVKIQPRFTSDTIFEHAYWKNATDIRAHHIQTAQYQHRHTGEYITRRRLDERIRIAGGWSPSERLEGFNRLPPRVTPRHVQFLTGQSDIDLITGFRNGQSITRNISRNPVFPTEPRYRQGPDGRFPTVQLRRHSDLSQPQILPPEPAVSQTSPLRQRRNGQYLTLQLRVPCPE
jgi:hypothetical protein